MIWLHMLVGFIIMFVAYEIAAAIVKGAQTACLKVWRGGDK